MTRDDLIAFEAQIAADFEAGLIKAPVHLAGGNEDELIRIFEGVDKQNDWICCQWRSHLHCLLKGVPPEKLRQAILNGHSIALCYPDHRIISSALVGGIAPIAVGIAAAIKRAKQWPPNKVWCFLGDMTAHTGIVHEAMKYAEGHELPVIFVVEDNGKSVCTDTFDVWQAHYNEGEFHSRYSYKLTHPHVGIGKFVRF